MFQLLLALVVIVVLGYLALRLLGAIGHEQGRRPYSDDSNPRGRLATSVFGALLGKRKH